MKHACLDDVKDIYTLLNEKYISGLPLLKELVQNANDAGASKLHIGFSYSNTEFENPLLKNSPAMFIINDSNFTKDDSCAIQRATGSSKKNEYTIGQFGLGLKTLFHYCEGYFYYTDFTSLKKPLYLITPWEAGDEDDINPYQDWWDSLNNESSYKNDIKILKLKLNDYICDFEKKLIFWIPLRTKGLLKEKHRIIDEFFDDFNIESAKKIIKSEMLAKVQEILPMMNNLLEVKVIFNHDDVVEIKRTQGLGISLKNAELDYESNNIYKKIDSSIVSGNINHKDIKTKSTLVHSVLKDDEIDGHIKELRQYEHAKKRIPHYGVLLTQSDDDTEVLFQTHYSCILPLSTDDMDRVSKFNLFIHGMFYLDSSRSKLVLNNTLDSSNSLLDQIKWNKHLLNASLRLIIPTLESHFRSNQTNEDTISQVTKELLEVIKTDNNIVLSELCKDSYWVNRLNDEKFKWGVIKSQENYYTISENITNYIHKLESFNKILTTYNIVNKDSSNLTNSKATNWTNEIFKAFIDLDLDSLLDDSNLLDYWSKEVNNHLSDSDNKCLLISKVKTYILNKEIQAIKKGNFEQLTALINSNIIYLDISTQEVLLTLNSTDRNILILPSKDDLHKNKNFTLEIAIKILKKIDSEISLVNSKEYHKISTYLIKNCSIKNEKISELKLFEITDICDNKKIVSINDFDKYLIVDANSPVKLIQAYQDAFSNIKVYRLMKYDNNFWDKTPFKLTVEKIHERIESFNHIYNNDFNNRKRLIIKFLKEDKEFGKTIRKLILGTNEDKNMIIYYHSNKDKSSLVSYEVVKMILDYHNQSNRLISDYEKELNFFHYESSQIIELNKIPKEVLSKPINSLDFGIFSEDQLDEIFKQLSDNLELIKLPIFQQIDNTFTSLKPDTEFYMLQDDNNGVEIPKSNELIIKYNQYLFTLRKEVSNLKMLDNLHILDLYLKHSDVYDYDKIFNMLVKIHDEDLIEHPAIKDRIQESKWLILANSKTCSLKQILHHRNYEKDFEEILKSYRQQDSAKYEFYIPTEINESFRKHKQIERLNKLNLYMNEEEVWENIGNLLQNIPFLQIGKVDYKLVLDVLELLKDIKSFNKSLILDYLSKWKSNVKIEYLSNYILPNITIFNPESNEQIDLLRSLEVVCQNNRKDSDLYNELEKLHLELLFSFLSEGKNSDILYSIKLPNENGDWKDPKKLCKPNYHVKDSYKLKELYFYKLFEFLKIYVNSINDEKGLELEEFNSTNATIDFFKKMSEYKKSYKDLISLFLSFIPDKKSAWAKYLPDFLDNNKQELLTEAVNTVFKDYQEYIERIKQDRNNPKQYNCSEWIQRIPDIKVRTLSSTPLKSFQVWFNATDQKGTNSIHSILGNKFDVESIPLLIEKRNQNFLNTDFIYFFYINVSKENFADLLKGALDIIFEEIYLIKQSDSRTCVVNEIWKTFSATEQLDIKISQHRILQDMTFYTRRFNKVENHAIKELLDKIELLENKKAYNAVNNNTNSYNIEKEDKEIKLMIKGLLEENSVQETLTSSVIKELDKAQYSKESTFFELFQNTDDAYVEKDVLGIDSSNYSFNINYSDNQIKIYHYGRKINYFIGDKTKKKNIAGFGNDLYNMLSLNISNKDNEQVTGKYGLGFKTVYFISKDVIVISGDIAIRTIGSIYPKEISNSDKENYLLGLDRSEVTIFVLTLQNEQDSYLISNFEKYADFLLMFSKRIKIININNKKYVWDQNKVRDSLFTSSYENSKLLTFCGTNWKIVFEYNNQGFQKLDLEKRVWVTVPTSTNTGYNLVINANFNIDIGRIQLASTGNDEIFRKIGTEFYQILKDIYESKEYPLEVQEYVFWKSLFDVLGNPDYNDQLNSIFWSKEYDCYCSLLQEINILPNDLTIFENLTNTMDINKFLNGELNNEKCLTILDKTGFPIKDCISERITDMLTKHYCLSRIEEINFENFEEFCNKKKVEEFKDDIIKIKINLEAKRSFSDPQKQREKKEKLTIEWEKQKKEEEVKNSRFENQDKYSYGWFKSIVEAMNMTKNDSKQKSTTSVKFRQCKISDNRKLLTLSESASFLMQSYETAEDCCLYLETNKVPLNIGVRGITIIGKTLEVLLKSVIDENLAEKIKKSDFLKMEFKSYANVTKIMLNAYLDLHLRYDYNFKENLPSDIEFIYGPPGTGKTYTTASLIRKQKQLEILVLAPTNRAADQIFTELNNQCNFAKENKSYFYRYGNTALESDENKKLLHNSRPTTVITTAIRYPYDKITNYKEKIQDSKWDLIVFDESSMISIEIINYIIHKSHQINHKCKYLIVGDPKQIPPIYNFDKQKLSEEDKNYVTCIEKSLKGDSSDNDKAENIYTMVNLFSFDESEQTTQPHKFTVTNLTEQRRSLREIGELYSEFSYEGLIKHPNKDIKRTNIAPHIFKNYPIQIIKFPITGGRVYQSVKVNKSPAHPYSAILIMELLKDIDSKLTQKIKVGVISPYRPQVNLLEKLIGNYSYDNLSIQVDTVHGFQGSEKEVMICCFNPPVSYNNDVPAIKTGDKRLINKEYIINVAISRAKSQLIIMLPSGKTKDDSIIKGYEQLKQIRELERIINTDYLSSSIIEKTLFNNKEYIYKNSNVIPHDQVNVYEIAPKKYLISYDEHSIDIQIGKENGKIEQHFDKFF